MAHHGFGGLLRVVDEHIQADNGVVAALQALQVGGAELQLAGGDAGFSRPAAGFAHHGLGEVGGSNRSGAELGQRQAQAAHAAAGITKTAARQVALLLQPGQHVVDGFLVADADVALHPVHLAAVAVDPVPALKAGAVEVGLHHGLLSSCFRGHGA